MKLHWRLAGLLRMFLALGCLSLFVGMSGGVGLAAPERPAVESSTTVATTTSVADATENFGDGGVTLTATVTAQDNSIINQGTVQFVVRSHNGFPIGQTKKVVVAGGKASFLDKIKTSTAVATYTITASYSGGTQYSPSSGTGTLTINPVPTTTTVDAATATFGDPSVSLTVTVAAINGVTIDKGSTTITVTNAGNTVIGSPVTAIMTTSVTSISYLIPSGTPGGSYTISATYTGNKSLASSDGTALLTIGPVATTTAPFSITTTVGTPTVYLSAFIGATVASTGAIAQGSVRHGDLHRDRREQRASWKPRSNDRCERRRHCRVYDTQWNTTWNVYDHGKLFGQLILQSEHGNGDLDDHLTTYPKLGRQTLLGMAAELGRDRVHHDAGREISSEGWTGKVTTKIDPPSAGNSAVMLPPCCSTICRLM